MYTDRNFKTKKELKEAVATRQAFLAIPNERVINENIRLVHAVTYYQPNGDLTGSSPPRNGTITLEGPHYPEPHRWYAQATVKDGEVVKVK